MKLKKRCVNYSESTYNFALNSKKLRRQEKIHATAGRDGRDKFQLYLGPIKNIMKKEEV